MSEHQDQAQRHRTSALRAVAHPLRLRMLSLLTGAELSAAEVARELDITHANASYHLRVLLDAGELSIASEEKIRGGQAKRYRHDWRRGLESSPRPEEADGQDQQGPGQHGSSYIKATADELVRRYAEQIPRSGNLSDAELWVDAETYSRARALIEEASILLHDRAQPPRTPGTHRMNLTAAIFTMTEGHTQQGRQ